MGDSVYHRVNEDEIEFFDSVEIQSLTHDGPSNECSAHRLVFRRKPAAIWLLFFFLFNSLAFGITAVPRINLVISLVCRQALKNNMQDGLSPASPVIIGGYNPQCMASEISSLTASFVSIGGAINGVLSAIMSTVLAKLSDRVGRIKMIAVSTVGLIAIEISLVAMAKAPDDVSYKWLYLAYAADGLSGSFALALAMASAYISDCTPLEKRNVQISRISGSMFAGISIGPLISNLLISVSGQKNPLLVFYICLSMRILSIVYLYFIPESLPRLVNPSLYGRHPESTREKKAFLLHHLDRLNPVYWLDRLVPRTEDHSIALRVNVMLLLLINLVIYAGAMGTSEVLILYPQVIFKWSNMENNLFVSIINAFRAAVSTIALPLLIGVFRKSIKSDPIGSEQRSAQPGADALDRTLICAAILFDIGGFIGYALSSNGILYTLCGALAAFGAIGLSTTEATLTKHVSPDRVGELMGGLGLLQAFVRILAPTTVNLVYSWTVESLPGMAFLGIGAFLCIGVMLTILLKVNI